MSDQGPHHRLSISRLDPQQRGHGIKHGVNCGDVGQVFVHHNCRKQSLIAKIILKRLIELSPTLQSIWGCWPLPWPEFGWEVRPWAHNLFQPPSRWEWCGPGQRSGTSRPREGRTDTGEGGRWRSCGCGRRCGRSTPPPSTGCRRPSARRRGARGNNGPPSPGFGLLLEPAIFIIWSLIRYHSTCVKIRKR